MIQPGLERISQLLKNVQFPWKAIHVAGTNGKGSTCGFASALLGRRNIRYGRFTSPHLIDRWDCIEVNGKTVSESEFKRVEDYFINLNQRDGIGASEFELLTATAFQLFNDNKVDVGVVEVGMGGKLDSTNILNNQVVSVIAKIARDHQGFLGNTLEEIALHKAGILRPNIPYIVNPTNESNVHRVIDGYAKEIGAGPRIFTDTEELQNQLYKTRGWEILSNGLLPFQRDNAVLAYLAFLEALKSLDQSTAEVASLLEHLRPTEFNGRYQMMESLPLFGEERVFAVDGAHNPDAAAALADWVTAKFRQRRPVTWVLAMTQGKDARGYLSKILQPGDKVVTTSFGPVDGMPWIKSMDPWELKKTVLEVAPRVTCIHVPIHGPLRALHTAKYLAPPEEAIILTGSLYLVGDLMRSRKQLHDDPSSVDIPSLNAEERQRVKEERI